MKEKERKTSKKNDGMPESDIHPGAYITDYDIDNDSLDTVDSADDVYTPKGNKKGKWANPASPPAADPPVPNRAHTEM